MNTRYTRHERIGEGGMGVVYRATDRLTGQPVALKQLEVPTTNLIFNSRMWTSDTQIALAHEFQVLASLRHPHIVSVLDYGFSNEGPFFTMTLLEGAQTVSAACRERSLTECLDLLQQMFHALHYLHQRGILHRDLKPDNVLVVGDTLYVLDFGLAIADPDPKAQPVGTLAYMAPEILQNQPPSHASDLYAAGIIAFECLTGRFPYRLGPLVTDLINDILYTEPRTHTIPDSDLASLVSHLMAKEPSRRPAQAYAVIESLAVYQGRLPVESTALRESLLQAALLVGRETELSHLQAALHQARAGQGGLWLVGGESGVGKSRLMSEVQIHARVQGMQVLVGQATAHLPYASWREPLRHLTLLTPDLTEREWQVICALVPDVVGAPAVSPKASGPQIQQAIVDILSRQPLPTLLLLEDLHDISAESLAILQALSEQVAQWPLLIVGTYRTDAAPTLPDFIPTEHYLPLRRLTAEQTTRLSRAMLGEAPAEVFDLLQHETEGNSFFLVEAVRALAESAGGLFAVSHMTPPSTILTGGMQAVIQRRLAQIPAEYQSVLKLVAVAGRELNPTILERLINPDTLGGFLYAAEPILDVYGEQWQFAHDKLREAVLDQLTPTERPSLYRQVAEALDDLYAGFEHPQSVLRAAYWQEALDSAKARAAYIDAGTHFLRLGLYEQSLGYFQAAMPLSHTALDQAIIYNEYGRLYLRLNRFDEALEALQLVIQLAEGDEERPRRARAFAYGIMSQIFGRNDRYRDALYVLNQALDINQHLELEQRVGENLLQIGQVEMDIGAFDDSLAHMQQGIEIIAPLDRHTLGYAQSNMGFILALLGDLTAATTHYGDALAIAREVGHRTGEVARLQGLGHVWRLRGQFGLAQQYLTEALTLADASHYGSYQLEGRLHLAELAMDEGRLDDAHALIEAAQALGMTIPVPLGHWLPIARLAMLEGDNQTVLEWSQQLWDAFEQQGRRGWLPLVAALLAWGLLMQGKVDAALEALAQVVPTDQTHQRALTTTLLAIAHHTRADNAAPTLHQAQRRIDDLLATSPDYLGVWLAQGLVAELRDDWGQATHAYQQAAPTPGLRREVEAYRLLLDMVGG